MSRLSWFGPLMGDVSTLLGIAVQGAPDPPDSPTEVGSPHSLCQVMNF